ncbi:hypothetical protein M0Q97_09825 [Candidatus Dojkabacteria bacterium]|jgi:hypothetical protein|nr:hypothetical protein [Candidatus Dojkabacteria bacterium]
MYVCRALYNYWDNCDTIEKGKHYICYFAPTKCVTHSSMNWNISGYFGIGSIEHSFSYDFNNFEIVSIYNWGKHMKKDQTKFCKVPINCIEIIDECEYAYK